VAPLRFGAGIKGKIVDSLAAGVPCVTTPVGAEGLDLPPAFDGGIAATAEAIAAAIQRLHDDAAANKACRAAGLRYIEEAFSEQNLDAAMSRAAGVPVAQRPPEVQQQRQAARTARDARHATLSEAS
jgi:glycosyltransferase involved in cell wall biosynthesis